MSERKNDEYLDRLQARRRILQARLANTPEGLAVRAEILKELNALTWAVGELEKVEAHRKAEANNKVAALEDFLTQEYGVHFVDVTNETHPPRPSEVEKW